MDLQALVNDAFARHQSGQLVEALRLYRTVLAAHPPIALVLSLAGDAATTSGDPASGRTLLRRALALEPRKSSFRQLLAFAEATLGNIGAAEESYAAAVECDPGNLSAMSDWANLIRVRQPEKAHALVRKCVLAEPGNASRLRHLAELTVPASRGSGRRMLSHVTVLDPSDEIAWKQIGLVELAEQDDLSAGTSLKRSLALAPADATTYVRLASSGGDNPDSRECLKILRRALTINWQNADAWLSLSNILHGEDLKEEAGRGFRRSILLNPGNPIALGNLLVLTAESLSCGAAEIRAGYRRARCLNPVEITTLVNYTKFLVEEGALGEAIRAARSAMIAGDAGLDMFIGLANGHRQSRQHAATERYLRWASAVFPDAGNVQSGLIMGPNYESGVSAQSLFRRHREWAERWAPAEEALSYDVDRRPDRPLHLGFLSPDLKRHPVGFFMLPVLEHLDRSRFRISVYSDLASGDLFTGELRRHAETWHDTGRIPDRELRQRIMEDRVDILFDLAGHSAGNRMKLFARRAAPLQMTWMGYVGTTGLPTMDYLVTDRFQTAPGTEQFYTEKWLVLPDDYICFAPSPTTPPVAPAPVLANGYVTFGSFNNPAKLTDEALSLWCDVLEAVPDARLLLSYRGFDDPGIQEGIRGFLAARGISPKRVSFETNRFHEEFLGGYGEMDIALDTLPYSGGLTTCEALWMGVPVVTLATQDHFAGRHSLSHLSNAGFPEWAVRTRKDFVDLSKALAFDHRRLAQIRQSLRNAVAASPLCDRERYARGVETQLKAAWTDYCAASESAAR
ncbi:tetratricopeptide repeat protein [Nisaea sp.]|uniref:tetratricopeptide repeat protein n=1 Tax=Nisaea sp. TaxID=2024842 RepID=UPI003B51C6AA